MYIKGAVINWHELCPARDFIIYKNLYIVAVLMSCYDVLM